VAPYPEGNEWNWSEVIENVELFKETISQIRKIRSEHKIPPKTHIKVAISINHNFLKEHSKEIAALVRANSVEFGRVFEKGFKDVIKNGEVSVIVEERINIEAEKKRVLREIAKLEEEIEKLQKRLSMEGFREKAPAEVVARTEEGLKEAKEKKTKLERYLSSMK